MADDQSRADIPMEQRPDPAEAGGPLPIPGAEGTRYVRSSDEGEEDAAAGDRKPASDLDDPGSFAGTAGTGGVNKVQDDLAR